MDNKKENARKGIFVCCADASLIKKAAAKNTRIEIFFVIFILLV